MKWSTLLGVFLAFIACFTILTPAQAEGVYTIRHAATYRYLDAYERGHDYQVVLREKQNNDSQLWIIKTVPKGGFTIQQKSTGRYLDAYQSAIRDYRVVTREAQNDDSQVWTFGAVHNSTLNSSIRQKSTGRYLDAHGIKVVDTPISLLNYRVVTRERQEHIGSGPKMIHRSQQFWMERVGPN